MRALRGFTLLEVMVALAIFVIISGAIYGAFSNAQQTVAFAEERSDAYQVARVMLTQINRELRSAYQPADVTVSTLTGDDTENGNTAEVQTDTLTFLTTAHKPLQANAPYGGVCKVSYTVQEDANNQPIGLYVTEDVHPGLEPDTEAEEPVLLSDLVVGLNCQYLDGGTGEWVDAWENATTLPAAVRVELVVKPPRTTAKPLTFSTTAEMSALAALPGSAAASAGGASTGGTGTGGTSGGTSSSSNGGSSGSGSAGSSAGGGTGGSSGSRAGRASRTAKE